MKATFWQFCSLMSLFLLFNFVNAQGATVEQEVFETAGNGGLLKLKVFLTKQPGHQVAVNQKESFRPEFERLAQQVRELIQPFAIGKDVIPQVIRGRLNNINNERDVKLDDMRRAIYAGIKVEIQPQQDRVISFVTNVLKGRVYAQVRFVNVLGVEIQSTVLNQLANHPDVAQIKVDRVAHLELSDTAEAIGADHFWDDNMDGNGTWDVAVVDSGVTLDHPALEDHEEQGGPFISKVVPPESYPDDNYGHGTAVAGIIASTNGTYKGIAKGLDKIVICKVFTKTYEPVETKVWDAVDWALDASRSPQHETADIINCSFGFDIVSGYSDSAKFFDAIVDDLHVMVVKSAGNEGSSGITEPGEMYNGIVVANMDNKTTVTRSDDEVRSSSSEGKADGRKKPDVIAPGHYITTTRRDYVGIGNPDFGVWTHTIPAGTITFTGTSFAAAHVTGAIALLYDYLSDWPKTLKAVLINTADDWDDGWGTGWDEKHGWGYINLDTALSKWYHYEVGLNPAGSNHDRHYWSGEIEDNEKITAVWNREVDYGYDENYPNDPGATVYAMDNLNLFLYDYTGEVKGDLLASSTSTVDNVEQVVYDGSTLDVLVEIRNMTSHSAAYVSVAFPGYFSSEGSGPLAPSRVANIENKLTVNELGQNFPNPFNPETWIPYSIAQEAIASVQIFDAGGKLIRQLNLGKKTAGRYFSKEKAAYWDGRNNLGERVASGVYFYYLTAGDYEATRKMIVLE